MSKKENFITEITQLLMDAPDNYLSPDALDFWNSLQMTADNEKPKFTENGLKILDYMQKNRESYNNLFKAKEIGEGLNITSRTASGALRKLVNDGYVEKVGENPVIYSLTSIGIDYEIAAED